MGNKSVLTILPCLLATLWFAACGGSSNGGVVFKLTPGAVGKWNYTILHTFSNGQDGILPNGLIVDKAGNLYGTTLGGGTFGQGTVFEVTP